MTALIFLHLGIGLSSFISAPKKQPKPPWLCSPSPWPLTISVTSSQARDGMGPLATSSGRWGAVGWLLGRDHGGGTVGGCWGLTALTSWAVPPALCSTGLGSGCTNLRLEGGHGSNKTLQLRGEVRLGFGENHSVFAENCSVVMLSNANSKWAH